MGKPGPKPVLDDVKQAEIFAALAQGASRRAAARYVGCSHNTIANTARRDAGFAERLRQVEMQCELSALAQINASFGKSWRAAAWYLERTRPQDYEKVQLRQPTFDQISEFWDECAGVVLQGVPVEHRGPVERRLAKASRRFARLTNARVAGVEQREPPAELTNSRVAANGGWLGLTTGKPQRAGASASLLPQAPAGSPRTRRAEATVERANTIPSAGITPAAHGRERANVDQQPPTTPGGWSTISPTTSPATRASRRACWSLSRRFAAARPRQ